MDLAGEPGARGARRLPAARLGGALLLLALVCWIVTYRRMSGMDSGPGTDPGSVTFFLGAWVTMMAAMMLPSALPMVLLFDKVGRSRRQEGRPAAPTWLFVLAYLAVWAAFGALALLVYRALWNADPAFVGWDRLGSLLAGLAVVTAGLYELTPLKRACLRRCRGPLHFVLSGWRFDARGALAMGAEHGLFCAGCCWGLMLILFALGVKSVTWMLVVTAIALCQKVLPFGDRLRFPLALVAAGAWIAIDPGSVPGLVQPSTTSM